MDLEILVSQIETIILYSHYESDLNKCKVMDFIDYASGDVKHHDYLKNILKEYPGMRVQEKIKIVSKIIKAMFNDNQNNNAFEMKMYLDVLTKQLVLIFSLLSNRLFGEWLWQFEGNDQTYYIFMLLIMCMHLSYVYSILSYPINVCQH